MKKIEDRPKKIVIVGGSHSGFSCAWMLINGPASHVNNAAKLELKRAHLVPKKAIKLCTECCRCEKIVNPKGAVVDAIKPNSKPLDKVSGGTFGTASRTI